MTAVVLDSSAVIAALLGEPGHDVVEPALDDGVISTVNLCEVVGHFARRGAAETRIRAMLDQLKMERVAFDEGLAYEAGLLFPLTRPAGLSLADRVCLALARRLGLRALTADRAWRSVSAAIGVEVELIR